ncbi:MAG: AAA family ATPase [Crocinitomicaceae bacterium]
MISSLRIENFALIDAAEINFNSGFTVITGETGSGKSILLNALNLILGERANFSVIGTNSDKSIVEADIQIKGFGLEGFFKENELDYFDTTIVRREINQQGRSRAFINDIPVQLTTLKGFTSQLIHIHSQYNTLELKDTNFQLRVLDVLANTSVERNQFSERYLAYKKDQSILNKKRLLLTESLAQLDYNSFQLNELVELDIDKRNFDTIRSQVEVGENADEIRAVFSEMITTFTSEHGTIDQLVHLKNVLLKKSTLSTDIKEMYERINAVLIEIQDITEASEGIGESLEFDGAELLENSKLLDEFNRICQKHNVAEQAGLIRIKDELSESGMSFDQLKLEISQLEEKLKSEELALNSAANKLHEARLNAVPSIENQIKSALSELKLTYTELIFDLKRETELKNDGFSKLQLLFSPNAGVPAVPVHQAASGGELSRVMLALQSLMSSKIQLRSMLFDEIDTGVSGDVAHKMAMTLKKMGDGMQVIAITHLPQVAAKGGQHLKVMKAVKDGKTKTFVQELSMNERIEETARLMSGDEINAAALDNAKALMN